MISKLPIRNLLIALAVIALLWLLISFTLKGSNTGDQAINSRQGETDRLVSAIQPISEANADSVEAGIASGSLNLAGRSSQIESLNNDELAVLTRRFAAANLAIENGQQASAIRSLEAITAEFPSVVEPYLNLASIYAEQRQLQKARETLLKGFEANPKAGLLFDHLKKVHGALAANSYRQALDTRSAETGLTKLTLARASSIVTQLDQSNQIVALEKQLQERQSQAETSLNLAQAQKVSDLENRLNEIRVAKSSEKSEYEKELVSLKKLLAEQSQALSQSQTAQREASARVVRAEQDASNKIAEITQELASQKTLLSNAESLLEQQSRALADAQKQSQALALRDSQREAELARLSKQALAATAISPAADVAVSTTAEVGLAEQDLERYAVDLVQSWARAWSAQDVLAYVNHYADNYSSSRSITRAQWLEQRQVRLTNKEFIKVNVSAFQVKDLGTQFSVTFSQYYQSNTVDDTVTKTLVFNKNGGDWSKAKIVSERLVSG